MKLNVSPFFLVFFSACSIFYTGIRPTNQTIPNSIKELNVSYEIIGWNGSQDRKKIKYILSAIHKSKAFNSFRYNQSVSSDVYLQFILEASPKFQFFMGETNEPVSWMAERDQKRYVVYLINRLFSIRTFFVVPDINRDDDFLVIRVFKKGKLVEVFRYDIESYNIFGWISLLLYPFDDERDSFQIYKSVVYKFLEDAKDVL